MLNPVDTPDDDHIPPGKLFVTFDPKVPDEISNEIFNALQRVWGVFEPLNRASILISRKVLDQVVATDPRLVITEDSNDLSSVQIGLIKGVENIVPAAVVRVVMDIGSIQHDDIDDKKTWTNPGEWHELNELKVGPQDIVDTLYKKTPRRFNKGRLRIHKGYPVRYLFKGETFNAYSDNDDRDLKPIEAVEKWANEVFDQKSAESKRRFWNSYPNR